MVQPTEKTKQQQQEQEQVAPFTHSDQRPRRTRRRESLVETLTVRNSMVATPSEPTQDHHKNNQIINRQGREQQQLQENTKQLSKPELQRMLEGDDWTAETRFRRKITPTHQVTHSTPTRQSSQSQHTQPRTPKRYGDPTQHLPKTSDATES